MVSVASNTTYSVLFSNFGIFLNKGASFVCEYKISVVLLLGLYFYGVALIDESDWIIDGFDFIYKVELSSIDCGESIICLGAVLFG